MKKLLILIALPVLALILTLSSCSKDDDKSFTEKYNNTYWSYEGDSIVTAFYFSTDIVIKEYWYSLGSDSAICSTLNQGTFSYLGGNYDQTTSIVTNSEDNYSFEQVSTNGQTLTMSYTVTGQTVVFSATDCNGTSTFTLTRIDDFSVGCDWNYPNAWWGCD